MIKRFLILITGTALFAFLTVPGAFATAELTLDDGLGNSVDVLDGGIGDVCPAADCVTFSGGLGDWSINVSTGTSKDAATPFIMDLNSVNKHDASDDASILTIMFSDDGFTPSFPGFQMDIGGTISVGGTLSASLYGGNSNDKFDISNQIASTLTFAYPPTAFSGSDAGPTNGSADPFSLTQLVTITFGESAGSASFDYSVTPVPEPGTLVLLGGGLLLTGIAVRRRSNRS